MGPVIELTFHVLSDADANAITRHPLFAHAAAATASLITTYFDTADGTLERASWLACEQRAARRRQLAVIAQTPILPGVSVRRFWVAPHGAHTVDAAAFARIPGLPRAVHERLSRWAARHTARDPGDAGNDEGRDESGGGHDALRVHEAVQSDRGHDRPGTLEAIRPAGDTGNVGDARTSDALPSAPDGFAPRFSLVVRRNLWHCIGPDGVSLDAVLERGKLVFGEHEVPVCELRLSVAGDENGTGGSDPQSFVPSDAVVEMGDGAAPQSPAWTSPLERLFAFAHVLQEGAQLFPTPHSIVDAGYARLRGIAHEPVTAQALHYAARGTPVEALRAISFNVARHWYGNESGTRETDDVEFLHQSRVALRRARTASRLFRPWLDDGWNEHVEPELKWLGALLGSARDWDVFVDETLPELVRADGEDLTHARGRPDSRHTGQDSWRAATEQAERLRRDARRAVQDALRSGRYARLSLNWLHWLARIDARVRAADARPGAAHGVAPHAADDEAVRTDRRDPAHRTLAEHARKRLRKQTRRVKAVTSLKSVSAHERHVQRIHAKRLRYALEFFAPLVCARSLKRDAKTAARIQSTLGAGNDVAIALQLADQLELTDAQRGFIRGYAAASQHFAARNGDRLVARLRPPELAKKFRSKT